MHKVVKLDKEEVELVRVDIINICCLCRQEEAMELVIRTQLRLKVQHMPRCSKGKV
jgi:hypothetical protein